MGHPRWQQQGAFRFLGIVRPTMDFDKKLRPGESDLDVGEVISTVLRRRVDKTTKLIAEYRQDAA
jgi:hypothetical protein